MLTLGPNSPVLLAQPLARGFLDQVRLEPSGVLSLEGWSPESPSLEVLADGLRVRPLVSYRLPRPDVVHVSERERQTIGYCSEYLLKEEARTLVIVCDGAAVATVGVSGPLQRPDYDHLLDDDRVLSRDEIYGVGPPATVADLAVITLAATLPPPILDVGCGNGALVRALRSRGIDCYGVEIGRPQIVDAIADDVGPFITLYDGDRLPFDDARFSSVTCIEVLEHIPDYRRALSEMARVAGTALFTLPDASAIPTLHRHHVVPWHLLEATHLHFFTQQSLTVALRPWFEPQVFSRMGTFHINGTVAHTSIVAFCRSLNRRVRAAD